MAIMKAERSLSKPSLKLQKRTFRTRQSAGFNVLLLLGEGAQSILLLILICEKDCQKSLSIF